MVDSGGPKGQSQICSCYTEESYKHPTFFKFSRQSQGVFKLHSDTNESHQHNCEKYTSEWIYQEETWEKSNGPKMDPWGDSINDSN